jgi:membrane-bound lytic murein transglycosylase B
MQRHAALLSRIERQFGVPTTLLMAIWTMETDNGTGDVGQAAGYPHARHPRA